MSVYFWTLAAVSILMLLYESGFFAKDIKRIFFILVAAVLICVAGFRYMVGTDYYQYAVNYMRRYSQYTWSDISLLTQPGLTVVAWIAKRIFDDYGTWFFLMSVITIVPVMVTIYRNSKWALMSVVMYMLLTCWHFPFNIVKQGVATAFLFAAYPLLRDRKFWRWCLVCLAAAMFHISAVLMIPMYFLAGNKINWKTTLLILAVGIVCAFAYDFLYGLMDFLKQGEGVVSEHADVVNNGVNVLRILVNCVPVLLFGVFHKLYDKEDKDVACLFNLSLLNAVLNLASMNSIYLNRFCNYTIIFNVLFIPILFKPLKGKYLGWIKPVALVLYFAFWAYDLYKGSTTVNFQWIFNR